MFAVIATPLLCTILSVNLPYKQNIDAYKDKPLNCGLNGVLSWNISHHQYTKLTVKSIWGVDKDYVVVIRNHKTDFDTPYDESIILNEDEYEFMVKSLPNARFKEAAYSAKDNDERSFLLSPDPHNKGGAMIQQFISQRTVRCPNCVFCTAKVIFSEEDIKRLVFYYSKLSKFVHNYKSETILEPHPYDLQDTFFIGLPKGLSNDTFVFHG